MTCTQMLILMFVSLPGLGHAGNLLVVLEVYRFSWKIKYYSQATLQFFRGTNIFLIDINLILNSYFEAIKFTVLFTPNNFELMIEDINQQLQRWNYLYLNFFSAIFSWWDQDMAP